MSYTVNLGCWGSIFAVPTDIVDKYIKIAGSAQLKVLLYILRHSGEEFDLQSIAGYLNMDTFDVKDCIEFWVSFNIIAVNDYVITPAASVPKPLDKINSQNLIKSSDSAKLAQNSSPTQHSAVKETPSVQVSPKAVPSEEANSTVGNEKNFRYQAAEKTIQTPHEPKQQEINKKNTQDKPSDTVVSRPLRPDPVYIAKRINEDKEIEALLNEAQYILGRPVSPNENAGMIMMHDNDGLPCEVILMLLTYGASNQKGMRQIEAMGAAWAKEGILTLEQADEKIRELEEGKEAYRRVQSILGLEFRKPSQKEEENYNRWINEWKFSDDIIKAAYDICINSKGKYIPNYVNTVLQRWYQNGIRTIEQVNIERSKPSKPSGTSSSANDNGRKSSFDINDLNGLSMFND